MAEAKTPKCNAQVLSALFDDKNNYPDWIHKIPAASRDQFDKLSSYLASIDNKVLFNEIYESLVNRIGLVKIREQFFHNPLAMFKGSAIGFGSIVQEMATDILPLNQRVTLESPYAETDQFAISKPQVKAAYYTINREQRIDLTLEDVNLRRSFTTPNGLSSLLSLLVRQMDKTNTVGELLYTKRLIYNFYTDTTSKLQSTQILKVPDIRIRSNQTKENIEEFLIRLKVVADEMAFPNIAYTKSGVTSQNDARDMAFILDLKATAVSEVMNYAMAYNPSYLNSGLQITKMNNFLSDTSPDAEGQEEAKKIIGVILDRSAIDINQTGLEYTQAYNSKVRYTNRFMHIEQVYTMSPYKNVVFVVAE